MRKAEIKLVCLLLVLMCICGCGAREVAEGEPMEIAAFTFAHRGMSSGDCYTYTAEAVEGGTKLTLLLNAGNVTEELTVEEPVLEQLGAIAGKYRLDLWDGFDKTKSRVSDGSGFTLSISLADGSEISAHGSNAFPDRYQAAKNEITDVFAAFISWDSE